MMTEEEIRALIIESTSGTENLAEAVEIISNEIAKAYRKGYERGKYDPDFDSDDCDNEFTTLMRALKNRFLEITE